MVQKILAAAGLTAAERASIAGNQVPSHDELPGRSRTRTACSVPVFLTGAESLGSGRQVQWSAEPIACDGPQGRH